MENKVQEIKINKVLWKDNNKLLTRLIKKKESESC